MTFNECKFCFYLFCTYYDGKNVRDIPNMEGMPQGIKIDASKIHIKKVGHVTTFDSPDCIFWFSEDCYNEFCLDHTIDYTEETKYFFSVEDFLNYFKIHFKDIV